MKKRECRREKEGRREKRRIKGVKDDVGMRRARL